MRLIALQEIWQSRAERINIIAGYIVERRCISIAAKSLRVASHATWLGNADKTCATP